VWKNGREKRFQVPHLNTNIRKEKIKIKSTKSAAVQKLRSEFSNNSVSLVVGVSG
jgi:hypothetical protein